MTIPRYIDLVGPLQINPKGTPESLGSREMSRPIFLCYAAAELFVCSTCTHFPLTKHCVETCSFKTLFTKAIQSK